MWSSPPSLIRYGQCTTANSNSDQQLLAQDQALLDIKAHLE